jgi:Ulp1 family protease
MPLYCTAHWVGCIIDFKKLKIILFDSIKNDVRCHNVLSSVMCLLNFVYKLDKIDIPFELKDWKYTYVYEENQIIKRYDSGLYVLMGFSHYISNNYPKKQDPYPWYPCPENSIVYRNLVFNIVVIIYYNIFF